MSKHKPSDIEQAISRTQLDVAFEGIAIDALTPLIQASDRGEAKFTHDTWLATIESVKQRVAEAYFGTSDRLPEESTQ